MILFLLCVATSESALAPRLHAQRVQALPIGRWRDMGASSGGVTLLRVRQAVDSLATRPTVTTVEGLLAGEGGWRLALGHDAWQPGNRRRLVVSAFTEQMPLGFYDSRFTVSPRRAGADVSMFRQMGNTWWFYASAAWRGGSRDTDFEELGPWPPCTTAPCPVALRAPPHATTALSSGVGIGGYSPAFSLLFAQVGRLRDTRDNIFAPRRGRYIDVGVQIRQFRNPDDWYGPQRSYAAKVDFRSFVGERSGAVWAFRALAGIDTDDCCYPIDFTDIRQWGEASSVVSPVFGGLLLRAERRGTLHALRGRLGTAVFAEAGGSTSSSSSQLGEGPLLLGGGFRYRLDRDARTTLRLDFGIGLGSDSERKPLSLRLALGEAF